MAQNRLSQDAEVHWNLGCLRGRAGRRLMMREQRQFRIAEVADSEVVCDEHFSFSREGFTAKREQRRRGWARSGLQKWGCRL